MAKSKKSTGNKVLAELEMRLGPAGLEFENDGVVHLYSWPEILRRLGSAGNDLTLNIEWGGDLLNDQIDWVDLLTYEDEIGVLEHNVVELSGKSSALKTLVEFEADRIRLYYDESCGGECGLVELRHAKGSRLSIHEISFRPFGSKQEILAQSFWFSGSLAY